MPLWIDQKYAKLLSGKLPLFKEVRKNVFRFRCPICGDSKKSKTKTRGYFYQHKDSLKMKCWNCQVNYSMGRFIKEIAPEMYSNYMFEAYNYNNEFRWNDKKKEDKEQQVLEKLKKDVAPAIKSLVPVSELPDDHICKKYVRNRKIPFRYWSSLFYTENFQTWVNENVEPKKFREPAKIDERLVIPFSTKERTFAYQGRSLDPNNNMRYITINPTDAMLVYGMDRLKPQETDNIFVLEGPIDSMYLSNAIAVGGSSLGKLLRYKNNKFIFVFDNEPRSIEIIQLMEKVIAEQKRICIWPKTIKQKDIGLLVENGMSVSDIEKIIISNTYQGLEASLQLNAWRKR